jgi:hypothetical protein
MPSTRAQRRRETVCGWADMPEELLAKVLEEAGWQQGGLRFSRASATVRLVCAGWKAVHDALVRRLVLRRGTTDEAMDMLVRCFPAVVSLRSSGIRRDGGVDRRGAAFSEQPCFAHICFHLLPRGDGRGAAFSEHPPGALVSRPPATM